MTTLCPFNPWLWDLFQKQSPKKNSPMVQTTGLFFDLTP